MVCPIILIASAYYSKMQYEPIATEKIMLYLGPRENNINAKIHNNNNIIIIKAYIKASYLSS